MPAAAVRSLPERALEVLRRAGNPFRNYFARNPDDEVCSRYHVPELFAKEREQLLGVVDLYRYAPRCTRKWCRCWATRGPARRICSTRSSTAPRRRGSCWSRREPIRRDADFLEYLLFQVIDTLLGGGKQKGARPLEFVGEQLVRGLLGKALAGADGGRSGSTCSRRRPGRLGAPLRPGRHRRPRNARNGSRQPRPAGRAAVPGRRRAPRL